MNTYIVVGTIRDLSYRERYWNTVDADTIDEAIEQSACTHVDYVFIADDNLKRRKVVSQENKNS